MCDIVFCMIYELLTEGVFTPSHGLSLVNSYNLASLIHFLIQLINNVTDEGQRHKSSHRVFFTRRAENGFLFTKAFQHHLQSRGALNPPFWLF